MLAIKRACMVVFLAALSNSLVASNLWVLSKVKPEEGASIYVEVWHYPVWSPLIAVKKSATLKYNEELSLVGIQRIKTILIRNAQEEFEVEKVVSGSVESTARRGVVSRIASIMGDDLVSRACDDFLAANPQLYSKATRDNARRSACFPGFLRQTGARLFSGEIVINQFLDNVVLPVAIAVTRKPGTRDFIVSELATGLTGRQPFYYYVKSKDLK